MFWQHLVTTATFCNGHYATAQRQNVGVMHSIVLRYGNPVASYATKSGRIQSLKLLHCCVFLSFPTVSLPLFRFHIPPLTSTVCTYVTSIEPYLFSRSLLLLTPSHRHKHTQQPFAICAHRHQQHCACLLIIGERERERVSHLSTYTNERTNDNTSEKCNQNSDRIKGNQQIINKRIQRQDNEYEETRWVYWSTLYFHYLV